MATERFILASKVGEAARLLPDSMLIEYHGEMDSEYPQRLAKRIEGIWRDQTILELRHTLRSVVNRYCSYSVLSQHFDTLMCDVVGQPLWKPDSSPSRQIADQRVVGRTVTR